MDGFQLSYSFYLLFFAILPPGRTVALIVTLNSSNDVFPRKDGPFGGQDDGWRHMGKIFPKNSPKRVWIGSFKPKRQNFYIAISQELAIWRTSDLRSEYIQIMKCTSWVVRHYSKVNTTWLTAAILNIDMTSYFRNGWFDLDKIRRHDAEWHADYGGMVEIETGSRIPIWRTFDFPNRK